MPANGFSPPIEASLDAIVRRHARKRGDATAIRFLGDGEYVSQEATYAQLDTRARQVAASLQQRGLVGEPVLLVMPEGVGFVEALLGCLYAGAIATPVGPPRRRRGSDKLEAIAAGSGARVGIGARDSLQAGRAIIDASPRLSQIEWLAVEDLGESPDSWQEPAHKPEAIALLQYTSGSTGDPKGVAVSHANLLENQRLIANAFGQDESIVVAGWLPAFHDMGLIGNILHPLYLGGRLVAMPPVAFLQKPGRWLRAITEHGATIAGGPDFAFDLCAREIGEADRESLDLSSLQVAFNGSEPLHAESLQRFAEAFEPHGFRPQAFCPCYGMAETTLLVSGSRKTESPLMVEADKHALSAGRLQVEAKASEASQTLVGSGPPDESLRVEIVDPETLTLVPAGGIGEIWIAGKTVAQGYWENEAATAETFAAQLAGGDQTKFLRTGDLGVLHGGELLITGRHKDLLIVRGANHYPQDLERTAEAAHPALAAGGSAAFAIDRDRHEAVCLVVEVDRARRREVDADAVVESVRNAIAERHELSIADIALVRPGALPRTTSGKRQRSRCRELYLADAFKRLDDGEAGKPRRGEAPLPPNSAAANQEVTALTQWIVQRIAARGGIAAASIDPTEPFARCGLDSLAAVRLSGELSDHLGRRVEPTIAYDYPTPLAAARFLVLGEEAASVSARGDGDAPLAIVGIGCRLPGAADPSRYWQALTGKEIALGPPPQGRWSELPASELEDTLRRGGYLPRIDLFDPSHFAISPREADLMDPQQRLLLEVAWETLEHGGQRPAEWRGRSLGVFVGVSSGDYARLQAELGATPEAYSATGGSLAVLANRLSFTLDLRGPSLAIDTACSSSLVAIHQAAEAIRRGDCEAALAGGVSLIVSPSPTESLAGAGMLSPSGESRAFCRGAEGFVRGEGCGLVLLKRLSAALEGGDRVLAV
ncbi:MAG: beta-ketoacyl synthase N-terminal-like domain-containing protein, partial [Planctomycetota bacterium]